MNFGSWNNARYFFNSGGFITVGGLWTSAVTPSAQAFRDVLAAMTPLTFNYDVTTANTGTGAVAIGFYDLSTSYQTIYHKALGAAYYTTSFVQVQAKLNAAAGTNGVVDFRILMQDDDTFPDAKGGTISFAVGSTRSAGAVVYPGTTVVTSGGFVLA